MKILKNYEKFLENKNTKLGNGVNQIINEGKIGDFFRNAGNKIKNFISNIISGSEKYGKDAWWYRAMAISEDPTIVDGKVEVYPYSVTQAEKYERLAELVGMSQEEKLLKDIPAQDVQSQSQVQAQVQAQVQGEFDEVQSQAQAQEILDDAEKVVGESINSDDLIQIGTGKDAIIVEMSQIDKKYFEMARKLQSEDKPLNEENIISLRHSNPDVRNVDAKQLKETLARKFRLKLKSNKKFFPEGVSKEDGEAAYMKAGGTRQRALFIWGAPGIGKTDILKQVASKEQTDLLVWHLSVTNPEDFLGVPGIKEDENKRKRTVFHLPLAFPTSNGPDDKGAILFFDEMNRGHEAVLAAALSLCLDGKIGAYTLPSKVLVVAAGNRDEEIVNGTTEIEAALANRFAHVNYAPKFKDWQDWAENDGKDEVHMDVLGFLETQKDLFHKLDMDADPLAWGSPRSWTSASYEYILALEENGGKPLTKNEVKDLFHEHVGGEAASRLANFLELKKHFSEKDLKDVYENPSKAKRLPEKADICRAVVLGIAFYKQSETLTDKDINNLFEYALGEDRVEFATALLGYVKRVHPDAPKGATQKTWINGLKAFKEKFAKELKKD